MFRICDLRVQILEWPSGSKEVFLRLTIDKMDVLVVFTENIYGHTDVVGPILRLRSIVQILILKYKVK